MIAAVHEQLPAHHRAKFERGRVRVLGCFVPLSYGKPFLVIMVEDWPVAGRRRVTHFGISEHPQPDGSLRRLVGTIAYADWGCFQPWIYPPDVEPEVVEKLMKRAAKRPRPTSQVM